jgi:hypothetical protein
MGKTLAEAITESIYNRANRIVESNFAYSNASQDEIDAYRDGLIKGMEEMYEIMSISNQDFLKERLKILLKNMEH